MPSFPPLGAMPDAPISDADSAWLASLPEHQRREAEWTLRSLQKIIAADGAKVFPRVTVAIRQLNPDLWEGIDDE